MTASNQQPDGDGPMAKGKVCSIPNCGKPHLARGWCNAHYLRFKRHNDPLSGRTPDGEAELWLIDVALPFSGNECLLWPFGHNGNGYGKIYRNGRKEYTHRIVCEAINGAPPTKKHEASHFCGNGHLGCCSPKHIRWATKAQNEADKLSHGTHNRGEQHGMSKLTEAKVIEIMAMRGSMSQREIGERFGVSQQNISMICRRKRWAYN